MGWKVINLARRKAKLLVYMMRIAGLVVKWLIHRQNRTICKQQLKNPKKFVCPGAVLVSDPENRNGAGFVIKSLHTAPAYKIWTSEIRREKLKDIHRAVDSSGVHHEAGLRQPSKLINTCVNKNHIFTSFLFLTSWQNTSAEQAKR